MYIRVETKTNPEAITIKEACEIADRSHVQIHNAITAGKLNYGFAFDRDGDQKKSGQKVVVIDDVWLAFVQKCRRLDGQREEQDSILQRDAIRDLGLTQAEITQKLIAGELTFDPAINKILKDEKYQKVKTASHHHHP